MIKGYCGACDHYFELNELTAYPIYTAYDETVVVLECPRCHKQERIGDDK
jgi:hypothetical protein